MSENNSEYIKPELMACCGAREIKDNDIVIVGTGFPTMSANIAKYLHAPNAVLMQESSRNGILDRINVLETTFESAYKDYRDAERRIHLYKDQTSRVMQAINMLQLAYETDGKNFEELLHMERQLINFNLEHEKAKADKNVAMAFINYLMGK